MPLFLTHFQFLLICLTNFSLFLVVSTWNFLPVILVNLGANRFEVGMVMGSLGVTSLGSLPFLAPLIDRLGRRIFVVGGILAIALSNGGFLLFDSYSPLMILVRLLQGVAFAACFNGCATAVVDIVPSEHRAQGIGLFGAFGSLAVAVGPCVGEQILLTLGPQGYFFLLMTFGLLGLLAAARVQEPKRLEHGSESPRGFFPTAFHDGYLSMMTTAMIFGAGFAAMNTFFPLHATSLGFRAGLFFVVYGVTLVAVRLFLGGLADRMDRDKLILMCLIGFGILLLWTSRLNSIIQTAFLGAFFGIVQGMSYPAMMARMVDRANNGNRGIVVSLFTGAFGVGINLSVLCWGFVAEMTSLPFMYFVGAMTMFFGAAVFIASGPLHKRPLLRQG